MRWRFILRSLFWEGGCPFGGTDRNFGVPGEGERGEGKGRKEPGSVVWMKG